MTERRSLLAVGWGGRTRKGGVTQEHKKSLWVLEVFFIFIVLIVSQIQTYVKASIRYFQYIQFIVCQAYLNKAVEKYPSLGIPFLCWHCNYCVLSHSLHSVIVHS